MLLAKTFNEAAIWGARAALEVMLFLKFVALVALDFLAAVLVSLVGHMALTPRSYRKLLKFVRKLGLIPALAPKRH